MKCPECGREIPDGSLFCENCAAEIKIVPEYETRLEEQISSGMESVTRVFEEEDRATSSTLRSTGNALETGTAREKAGTDETGREPEAPEFKDEQKAAYEAARADAAARRRARYEARRRQVTFMIVFLVGAISAAVVLLVLYFFVFSRQAQSVSYYVGAAYQYSVEEKYEEAAAAIEEAIVLNEEEGAEEADSASLYLLAAEYYMEAGMPEASLDAANRVLEMETLSEDDEEAAYDQLIRVYISLDDYEAIAQLLAECANDAVLSSYRQYILYEPSFSEEEGTYADLLSVEILCDGDGTVFYTMDGSVPTTSSNIYREPIELTVGTYTISAVYVNRAGIQSEVVVCTYQVLSSVPDAPVVTPNSGTYVKSMQITASFAREDEDSEDLSDAASAEAEQAGDEAEDESDTAAVTATGTIYYTTDGTDPTLESKEYTGPITMPEGSSVFRFAVITEDGISSEVVEREYTYRISSSLSEEDGINYILVALILRGEIVDTIGTLPGGTARFTFEYLGIEQISGSGNYLIYAESLVDDAGNAAATGRIYAVNAANGTVNLYADNILTPIG